MWRGVLIAALALCVALPARAELGRDDQWTFIPAGHGHGARAELRGDSQEGVPTELIIQIECLSAERTLLFRYDASPYHLLPQYLSEPIALILGDDGPTFRMPTQHFGERLEGRLALTAEIAAAVRDTNFVRIWAANDMEEAWLGGQAPALRRLVRECWGQ